MIKPFYKIIKRKMTTARQEWQNLNYGNEDTETVRQSEVFSAYKGKLVIRKAGFKKRAFSFGVLFIPKNEKLSDEDFADLLKHEYGHSIQLKELGPFRYFFRIAIPSVKSKITDPAVYFNQKHEITADLYGGVRRKTHTPEAIEEGLKYMELLSYK